MRSQVRDVMTREVVAVEPATPFKRLVELLTGHRVSALPVVDPGGRPLGVVSETDLVVKEEHPSGEQLPVLERWRHRAHIERAERGGVAEDFMHGPAVTIAPEATVVEAARRMHAEQVRRLLVVDGDGRLVGIVTRGDLLRVFVRRDEDIREEIEREVLPRRLWLEPGEVSVTVKDGIVTVTGKVEQRSLVPLVVRAIASVEGVVRVDQRIGWEYDDTAARRSPFEYGL